MVVSPPPCLLAQVVNTLQAHGGNVLVAFFRGGERPKNADLHVPEVGKVACRYLFVPGRLEVLAPSFW